MPADVAGDNRYGAELPHGPGVAEDHAVDDAPLDVGQGHPEKGLQAAGAQYQGSLLLFLSLGFHQRDQFPGHEREGDEDGGQDNARYGEDDLDVVRAAARAPATPADRRSGHRSGRR